MPPATDLLERATQATAGGPFDPLDAIAYARWRDAKLAAYPATLDGMMVEVSDPRALTAAERAALADRIARTNMAIYRSAVTAADKSIPRLLGAAFGLRTLDHNWLADEDGISSVTVCDGDTRGEMIPYTDRPIRWHTDGYYNPPARRIRGMILHCVSPAAAGGVSGLMDPEIAYIRVRDRDPALVAALMRDDAMTIPAREDEHGVARPAERGPVFSVDPASGALHMRYTARTRSIEWHADDAVRAAAKLLETVLSEPSPFRHQLRLEAGMGLLCNNVLHDRTGFTDDPGRPRLLYRARFLERIADA